MFIEFYEEAAYAFCIVYISGCNTNSFQLNRQILQMLNDPNSGVREAAILCIEVSIIGYIVVTPLLTLAEGRRYTFKILSISLNEQYEKFHFMSQVDLKC